MSKPVLTRSTTNREGEDLAPDELAKLHAIGDLKKANITLVEFNESPPCWKVRAMLHYYELPYTSVHAYPGSKVEGLDDAYHKIPKLTVNGVQINDSAVVIRTLAPLVAGEEMTAVQIELEKRNNIKGLMGALEAETAGSFTAMVNATRVVTADWNSYSYMALKPVVPYMLGALSPLLRLALSRAPHGKDGGSLEHGRLFRQALGDAKFFHGERVGPLDLSLYGTLACFAWLKSPPCLRVLAECDLQAWFDRVDEQVKAKRPLVGA